MTPSTDLLRNDPPSNDQRSQENDSDIDPSDILLSASAPSAQDSLYNESLDFEDEEWLNAKISEFKIEKDDHYQKGTLACALCFTPVSFYYSKIDILQYETKYIENCEILKDVIQRDTCDDSIYHPVKCMECDLEIGLEDAEGVVHFYQVFAS